MILQDDVSKFVAGLISSAIRNGVVRDNALPIKKAGLEKGGSSLAVHNILVMMVGLMSRRDFLQGKHFIAEFCLVLKVSALATRRDHPLQHPGLLLAMLPR